MYCTLSESPGVPVSTTSSIYRCLVAEFGNVNRVYQVNIVCTRSRSLHIVDRNLEIAKMGGLYVVAISSTVGVRTMFKLGRGPGVGAYEFPKFDGILSRTADIKEDPNHDHQHTQVITAIVFVVYRICLACLYLGPTLGLNQPCLTTASDLGTRYRASGVQMA